MDTHKINSLTMRFPVPLTQSLVKEQALAAGYTYINTHVRSKVTYMFFIKVNNEVSTYLTYSFNNGSKEAKLWERTVPHDVQDITVHKLDTTDTVILASYEEKPKRTKFYTELFKKPNMRNACLAALKV